MFCLFVCLFLLQCCQLGNIFLFFFKVTLRNINFAYSVEVRCEILSPKNFSLILLPLQFILVTHSLIQSQKCSYTQVPALASSIQKTFFWLASACMPPSPMELKGIYPCKNLCPRHMALWVFGTIEFLSQNTSEPAARACVDLFPRTHAHKAPHSHR